MLHHRSVACVGPKVAELVIKVLSAFGIAMITTVRNIDIQMKTFFVNNRNGSISTAQRDNKVFINLRQNFTLKIFNMI